MNGASPGTGRRRRAVRLALAVSATVVLPIVFLPAAALPGSTGLGAAGFEGGEIVQDLLCVGGLPPVGSVQDDLGAASSAFRGRLQIELPDTLAAQRWRAQLGDMVADRTGVATGAGTRSDDRFWIRDGALASQALLRAGYFAEARAFLDGFAGRQYANGKIPCAADARGAGRWPRHDCTGGFIFLVAECFRYDHDVEKARALWPRVAAGAAYLDSLRGRQRTAEFSGTEFFGLMPPSIGHGEDSAKPTHSYADNLWALRGYRDAVFLAESLGLPAERVRWATSRDEFAHDLNASVRATLGAHNIDYVPGCAELGDFDAASATIALSPVQAGTVVPQAAMERTFEKYWEFFEARRQGAPWEPFTPHEIRSIGAFVRLGWRDRANLLLQYFLQSPAWGRRPESVWHDERAPRALGDLPHSWAGSDYVRSVLDMLAYDREADQSLVVAAGVPFDWLLGSGLRVRSLQTPFGAFDLTMRMDGERIVAHLDGALRLPPGGIRVLPPFPWPAGTALVNGAAVPLEDDGGIRIGSLPADLTVQP